MDKVCRNRADYSPPPVNDFGQKNQMRKNGGKGGGLDVHIVILF